MKKQILSFALMAVMISYIATSCSSSKKATASDSAATKTVDTSKAMNAPPPIDTAKHDTTKKKPPM